MEASLQELTGRLNQLSDQFRELRDGVQKAIRIADDDPEMALTRARKVLEYVVRDVFEHRIKEPPGTRPLENLLDRLVKDHHFPVRLDAYANTVRKLGNVGTHNFSERITAADVYQSLTQLMPILEWYFDEERPDAGVNLGLPHRPEEAIRTKPADAVPISQPAPPRSVEPKGLRSFDANDSDAFLQLLPGARDKDGLPEHIRFWKHRLETTDELTFTVGVIYGPSGCGKTSLVKAGLLPRLSETVTSIYIEATADETEARLLNALKRQFPALPGALGLRQSVAALRQGDGLQNNQKVVIVLDQFEQWLHANRQERETELAQALRQCDGDHVQCILMVRDDFWVALSRFMETLQIELVQGQNTALVDLFELRHAKKVLTAFGRAFGALPDNLSKEQESFLDQAVTGLAQDGRVISVRLALFADMVKGDPWTPKTLKDVGGMEGVGVTFLEKTFGAANADQRHRLHQKAARAVLRALLPEQGTNIKGNMRSRQELLDASGYAARPAAFNELIRILDNEVRLITPTDPEGAHSDAPSTGGSQQCYQLTHDYLVPSLQEWLTRKQRETRRGRAELRLAYQAAVWNTKRQSRSLPGFLDWIKILALTDRKGWSGSQRVMMRVASRHYVVLSAAVLLVASLLGWISRETYGRLRATAVVGQLLTAEIGDVPDLLNDNLPPLRRWANPQLAGILKSTPVHSKEHLRASLALLDDDSGQTDDLYERLLNATPEEAIVIRDRLLKNKADLIERFWAVAEHPSNPGAGQCLRAGAALAAFDPGSERWNHVRRRVAEILVSGDAASLGMWMNALRPVGDKLLDPLADIFRDPRPDRAIERSLATSILADYASKRPEVLADLVQDADEKQFPILFRKLETYRDRTLGAMKETLGSPLDSKPTDAEKERLAKRQANAAIVLLQMRQPENVWPLLRHSADPRARSYLMHHIRLLQADPKIFIERLALEREVSVRRALFLILGGYTPDQLSPNDRTGLLAAASAAYENDSDAGVHGAAEWLLSKWGQTDKLQELARRWAADQKTRQAREAEIRSDLAGGKNTNQSYWYVSAQGLSMVVVPARLKFRMGSPTTEAEREGGPEGDAEQLHWEEIPRSFAIAAREITVDQFLHFRPAFDYKKKYAPAGDCPVNALTWYDAVAYCNWLSEKEGLDRQQWCYEPNRDGKYAEGMRFAPDYLKRVGYRLPTEAEWEYCCRAGALTSRYYGETDELLDNYAWYLQNSANHLQPVGVLKPNDLGLFDMLGNALEWCQSKSAAYHDAVDLEELVDVNDKTTRVLRGGSFFTQGLTVRSADRYMYVPTVRPTNVGFRPARTYR
jgi:formylglycine-generating enzyme required for sulfatase activity